MSTPKTARKTIHTTTALAEQLGLSRWTVSRVLNEHGGVKAETRERVWRAMSEYGFQPNPMARGLRGSRTKLIGVCFQELESPILAKKTAYLQRLLRGEGYRSLLELTAGDARLEEAVINHYLSLKVDGMVLVGSILTPDHLLARGMREKGVPVVLIDPLHTLPFPRIHLDRGWAMRLIMQHLYALGHRRYGFLGINARVPYGLERARGLRRELRRLKLSLRENVLSVAFAEGATQDYDYGWRLAERLLQGEEYPTALVALNDRVALGAIKYLRDAGYRLPNDFSIVGFDDLAVSAYSAPSLTTISQEVEVVMSAAIESLFREMKKPSRGAGPVQWIRPVLKPRESTAPPRKKDAPED